MRPLAFRWFAPSGFAVALAAVAVVAAAENRPSEWKALEPGLWYRQWTIDGQDPASPPTGHVFRADPRTVHLTVLDARRGDRRVATVSTLREESGAHLVVNGGFFDENGQPLGLVVGDGKQTSPLRNVDQGIFLIASGQPIIQHSRDTLPPAIDAALQSGPRLIVDGKVLKLKPQVSRRTCLCLPGDGTVMIVVLPSAVSLPELAESLSRPASEGGLGCWSALNLDGGPSTQLSASAPGLSLEIPGGWGVPNAVAILPRREPP